MRPEFELPELEGIPVEKKKLEVTDEQIEREIDQLRKYSGLWAPKDGAVEVDDRIIADVVLKTEGLEEAEKLDNVGVMVRPGGFVGAVPVEKLDELLAGAKAGDERQIDVEVPRTYFREEYRGKKVDVTITVKEIKFLRPAELDKDFLARFGVEDENDLKERMRDQLQSRLESQVRAEMTAQLSRYMLENTSFELPLDIVGDQANMLLQRQYVNLLRQGLSREQIEEQTEKLRSVSEEQSREQLKTFFIMDKVAKKLEIDVTDEEVNGYIAQLAIQQGQRPEKMREQMARDGSLGQFRRQVREDKCVARLLESAKVTQAGPEGTPEKQAGVAEKSAKKTTKKTLMKASAAEKKQTKKRKTATKKKTGE